MNLKITDPPRVFNVGREGFISQMKECAKIELKSDEMVTFLTENGAEYDISRKSWGFYATPSLNGRLLEFGLRAALIRGCDGKFYIFLVEKGKEYDFNEYLAHEKHRIVLWMDSDDSLTDLEYMKNDFEHIKCICNEQSFKEIFCYNAPPEGEVLFQFNKSIPYERKVFKCNFCGHYLSIHDMDTESFYTQDYVTSTYKNEEGILKKFEQIISLPTSKSDNLGRVKRINDFFTNYFSSEKFHETKPQILDVGSGLCVFLYEMKKHGWNCVALDPDERNVRHAKKNIQIEAICNDFMHINNIGHFDLISFNKVIEHVEKPIEMLSKSLNFLKKNGIVYIEVPDGEIASLYGPEREEFFIDHFHIFSATSLSYMINQAGFKLLMMERIYEPSTKYTLFCFITPI